jgi:hypothetical protein
LGVASPGRRSFSTFNFLESLSSGREGFSCFFCGRVLIGFSSFVRTQMVFSKRLKGGGDVDGFGLSEARIEGNGSHFSPMVLTASNVVGIREKVMEERRSLEQIGSILQFQPFNR